MLLYIARHAWAGDFGDPRWPADDLRELTPKGIERYRNVAQLLADRGVAPSVIATSPYTRCRQTAEILAAAIDPVPSVETLDALQPCSDIESLIDWLRDQVDRDQSVEQVCWVGHRPDVGNLTAALIGRRSSHHEGIRFAKGAVAAIKFHGSVEPGAGELSWLATAKMLGV